MRSGAHAIFICCTHESVENLKEEHVTLYRVSAQELRDAQRVTHSFQAERERS